MYTNQEIFDKVATHLFTQGKAARGIVATTNGELVEACKYRSEDEQGNVLSCAVGCLIPDEIYDPMMENVAVHNLVTDFPVLQTIFPKDSLNLLCCLQSIHDQADSWESTKEMKIRLRYEAAKNNLNPSILDNLQFADGR